MTLTPPVYSNDTRTNSLEVRPPSVADIQRALGSYRKEPVYSNPMDGALDRLRMIALRMRWPEGYRIPFDFLQTHVASEKVFVFLVVKGQHATLEDDAGLFPSDTLITQLRLLE